ncbi:amidohydrolase family protein [Schumannella sp. 10F1B-5-1]|uniref:amidohydrolase family protein n=1 Tax=Schumannella sp. 10F1B-5-1 TaxID=2590780 RepID=UPI001130CEAD|nr:amidohydrolase family protein [Schumannella sp. 10F1B-5-1]TPW70119.1 amidohydrolase family protein [Schumannella sp. 10F1B-5-1]
MSDAARALLVTGARLLDPATPASLDAGASAAPQPLLVVDDRIAAVGTDQVDAHPDAARAERLDLDGRAVTPGLWDHHVHLVQWAISRRRVDVSAATTAAQAAAILREHARVTPPESGSVLVGHGFRDALWPDALDAALLGDTQPIAAISHDLHTVWANPLALRVLGLDETGTVLREKPAFDASAQLSALPVEVTDRWVADAVTAAAQRGVVGIRDLEMSDAAGSWLRRRADAAFPRIRVRAAVYPHDLALAIERGMRTDAPLAGADSLVVGGEFKLFADGSLNTRTAHCVHAYDGMTGAEAHGLAVNPGAELEARAREGLAVGLVPTIHGIGDLAVTRALDVYESLDRDGLSRGGWMEHAQLVDPADLPRFARLGIEVSVQPEHAMDDRDVADALWAGRTERSFAWRALQDAGVRLWFGSDAPVAPLDPWVTMAAAVTRARDGREAWHPEQTVPFAAALAASVRSSLTAGQPADLAILDADPVAAAADATGDALRGLPVAATLLAGEFTHRTL